MFRVDINSTPNGAKQSKNIKNPGDTHREKISQEAKMLMVTKTV